MLFRTMLSHKSVRTYSIIMSKRPLESDAKASVAKKAKVLYRTKYNISWNADYAWINKSSLSANHAFCSSCNVDFSIGHGGINDVKQHGNSQKHLKKVRSTQFNRKVNEFFVKQKDDDVTKAEVLFANFVVEHNLSFLVADHFTDLAKVMFPDSKIAQKFSCKRTKTGNIIKNAIGPQFGQQVSEMCKTQKFTVMLDESNDQGGEKAMAILVRVYDRTAQRIKTKFLDMPICNIGTGENLFRCLNDVFVEHDIPWSNCVGYVSDNANVMIGKKNSVLSRVKEKNPSVISLGCACHLASLCAKAGIEAVPLPIEDLLVEIFYHFHHSAKRKEEYKEFLEFTNTEPMKIIKHCSTRWLSLEKCVKRILQQWPALRSYFSSHPESEQYSRVSRCKDRLCNDGIHLFYLFLAFIMPILDEFNTTFQSENALVGHLHDEMVLCYVGFWASLSEHQLLTVVQN